MDRRVPKGAKGSVDLPHTRQMPDGPVGKVGRVLVRIREGDPPGEVLIHVGGMPETYVAYCDEAIPVGADVLVVGARRGRGVDVVPWDSTLTIPER
ncbi:MAG: hypothetical protein QOE05_778 [Actinomycetota bacterium]|jgi:nucleotide-binding universal stress UspA family protein|nr:hypothetical protein [Actinomycetota bacterium]